jgi:hypothetical protein
MILFPASSTRVRGRGQFRRQRKESGMAVIVILALVAIMMIYIAANLKTLSVLHRDLNLIETRQVRRLAVAVRSAPAIRPPGAAAQSQASAIPTAAQLPAQ